MGEKSSRGKASSGASVLDIVKVHSYRPGMAPTSLRDTVLRAAVDYIAEHGADGLSIRQVAVAAGVSHQAPYHHFSDRTGIFQAIALDGFTMLGADLRTALQRVDSDPHAALLQAYVDFAVEHVGHFRVMFRADLTHIADHPELAAAADDSFDVLVAQVQQSLGRGAAPDDVRTRVVAMWSLAHGLATLLIDGPLEHKVGPLSDRKSLARALAEHTGLLARRNGQQ